MTNNNQTVMSTSGCPIAGLGGVCSLTEITLLDRQRYKISFEELEQVDVPEKFMPEVVSKCRRNRDVFFLMKTENCAGTML